MADKNTVVLNDKGLFLAEYHEGRADTAQSIFLFDHIRIVRILSGDAKWKIGDTVYQPSYKFTPCSACNITPRYKHDMDCEDCCHECDSERYPYIYEGRVCKLNVISNELVLINVQFKEKYDNSSFKVGREVFLTKEEAEEKLKDKKV